MYCLSKRSTYGDFESVRTLSFSRGDEGEGLKVQPQHANICKEEAERSISFFNN